MTKAELKRVIEEMFSVKVKEAREEEGELSLAQHKEKVLKAVRNLNIKVSASEDLGKAARGETGLFPDDGTRYSSHYERNALEIMALFQEPYVTDSVLYSKFKGILPEEDSKEVLLIRDRIGKLLDTKCAILGNLKGMSAKDGLKYLKSIGIEVPEQVPEPATSLLAPVDVNFIKSLTQNSGEE